nr:MAG TPA_asm: hypothetical protein [Caudoviricetes sp.]
MVGLDLTSYSAIMYMLEETLRRLQLNVEDLQNGICS